MGWGEGLGRALQEGERPYGGEEGGWTVWQTQKFWALPWWYLEAGGDAGPKAEVQEEQNNCV